MEIIVLIQQRELNTLSVNIYFIQQRELDGPSVNIFLSSNNLN